jgi:hypothetical protein
MPQLNSDILFTIRVRVDTLHDVGETPIGTAHFDQHDGGSFEAPCLHGSGRVDFG